MDKRQSRDGERAAEVGRGGLRHHDGRADGLGRDDVDTPRIGVLDEDENPMTIGRVSLVVGALVFATASCGKKQNPEHAQLCRSYCAFVAAEQKDERKAEQTAQGAAQAAGIFNASSDEEAKRMGELARHDCIEMREQLSSARAHRRAIERARAIVASRESSSVDSDEPLPDCLTVSPAQMRAFAEKEAKVTPSPAPDDEARCQTSCEQDLDQKLATIH